MAMRKSRVIIHIDLDAFYCAVEELLDPTLKEKPIAVGGKPENRGVISSCSYAARFYGVRSAMPTAKAIQLCPALIVLPGHRKEYNIRSREVMSILYKFTQQIEQISIDEAFLDLSDVQIEGEHTILAKKLQRQITKRTSLPCSLGIASNKMVAKIATDVGKSSRKTKNYPKSIQFVPPGEEATFLAPLPIEMLWGIGEKIAKQLNDLGIHKIGDLAYWPQDDLIHRFGQHGYDLHLRSKGIDHREVSTYRKAKSISQEITFREDVSNEEIIIKQINKQSKKISKDLINGNLLASVVKLKIRWPNFSTISRQVTLTEPLSSEKMICDAAIKLLNENWNRKHPIRLIGVGVSGLCLPSRQLSLWDQIDYEKLGRLESAINEVRQKFGDTSINMGIDNQN
jgi:DNA polymerase-4